MKMKDRQLIVWDIEGDFNKFRRLLANKWLGVNEEIFTILIWDVIGHEGGRIDILRYCYDHRERVRMILWNKDLLAQRIISWEQKVNKDTPGWLEKFLSELQTEDTWGELEEYFMTWFHNYIELWDRFILSHMRPLPAKIKKLKKHSPDEIVWNIYPDNRPYERKWKVLVYWHESKDWKVDIRLWKEWRVSSIWIDSWAWKSNNLSWLIISKGARYVEVIDSWWALVRIAL